jgi:hypothetical protein
MKGDQGDRRRQSGEALVKHKGFQGALEALLGTTDGSQKALHALFPDIRANAAVLALTGSNAKSAEADLRAFTNTAVKGAAGKVFAEQSKSAAFQLQQLKANLSASAITLGNEFLPVLNNGARAVSKFLSNAQKSGAFGKIGDEIKTGFGEAIHVIGDFVHVGGQVVGTVEDVAGALGHLAGIDLGDPTQVEAIIAAYLGFEAVQVVGPILVGLASGIQTLVAAARTAPTISAFFADLSAAGIAGPIGLAAAAIGGLAAAVVLLTGHEHGQASAAEAAANALRDQAAAARALTGAENDAAHKTIDANRATLLHHQALQRVKQLAKEGKQGTDAYTQAVLDEQDAALRSHDAHKALADSMVKVGDRRLNAQHQVGKDLNQAQQQLDKAKAYLDIQKKTGNQLSVESATKKVAAAQKAYNDTLAQWVKVNERGVVSQLNIQRASQGLQPVTEKNTKAVATLLGVLTQVNDKKAVARIQAAPEDALADLGRLSGRLAAIGKLNTVVKVLADAGSAKAAIAALKAVVAGVPQSKVVKILASTNSAKVQIAAMRALIQGVPASKVTKILANTQGARSQLAAILAAINALHDKNVTVTTTYQELRKPLSRKAAGRGKEPGEVAVIGEGAGPEARINPRTGLAYMTTGPQIAALEPDDYVIPLEDRYRGRAVGLWMALARDLGIPGYARGRGRHKPTKPAKGKHHYVPPHIEPLSIPLDELQSKTDKASQTVRSDSSKAHGLEGQIHNAERTAQGQKGKAKQNTERRIKDLRGQLATVNSRLKNERALLAERKKELAEAKANQAKIDHWTSLANQARDKMAHADAIGDENGFTYWKGQRIYDLGQVQALLVAQRKKVHDQKFGDTLDELITGGQGDIDAANADKPTTSAAAELTDAQQARLDQISAAVALASLTDTLDDDKAALGSLVGFRQGVLNGLLPTGNNALIAQAANDLKDARDQLASLTDTSNSPDLQAQLDQANARAAASAEEARANATALAVLGGPGDIGAGGRTAFDVANRSPVQITVQTLHPGDPRTVQAIGAAAAAGFGYQGFRPTTRQKVGP